MAQQGDLIPLAVRIALVNAVGGWGPYTLRQIEELFNSYDFFDEDLSIPDTGAGVRRTAAERFQARIDWTSPDQAQRYLDLISEVLEHYPEENDEPGSPGRALRRALDRGGFLGSDGILRLPGSPPTQAVEPDIEGIWIPDRPRVFLSHVTSVRRDVSEIAQSLESFQCSCFVAHAQIEPSRDWQDTIEVALATCDVLVAYVTTDFHRSAWTDQEVGWVLGREVQVIPVNAGLQPYGFFGSRQSLAANVPNWLVSLNIFQAIVVPSLRAQSPRGSIAAPLIARTVVRAFCQSPSFDSTRQRFPLLRLIPLGLWKREMLEELQEAAEFNDQISEAGLYQPRMGAREAIRLLIGRVARGQPP